MLASLIDDVYVVFGNQSVGISMGTTSAPLLADLFLYSYKAEFIQRLVHEKGNHSFWHSTRHLN